MVLQTQTRQPSTGPNTHCSPVSSQLQSNANPVFFYLSCLVPILHLRAGLFNPWSLSPVFLHLSWGCSLLPDAGWGGDRLPWGGLNQPFGA